MGDLLDQAAMDNLLVVQGLDKIINRTKGDPFGRQARHPLHKRALAKSLINHMLELDAVLDPRSHSLKPLVFDPLLAIERAAKSRPMPFVDNGDAHKTVVLSTIGVRRHPHRILVSKPALRPPTLQGVPHARSDGGY